MGGDMDTEHLTKARADLGRLQSLSDRTSADEQRILDAALARMDAVQADIEKLRPTAMLHASDGQKYRDAVKERGMLARVIARARSVLD